MKTLTVLLSSMLGIWVCADPIATGNTQEKSTQEKNTQGKRQERRGRMILMIQDLNLTDDQESKIKDIQKEFRPKVEEASKNLRSLVREEMGKIQAILTSEQKEKLQTLKEDRRERRAERLSERLAHFEDLDLSDAEVTKIEEICKETRTKIEKALEALDGTLTEEQQKARDEAIKAGKTRREVIEAIKLTDDQKKIVMSACKELTEAVREEMGKIKEELTEQQQAKLQELKDVKKEHIRDRHAQRVANAQDLNLTDEQKSKIEEVRKEYHPKVHEAGNKLRGAIRGEVDAIVVIIKE